MIDREVLHRSLPEYNDIIVLEEVDSTNDYAKRIAKDGATDKTVIIATSQTNGRGRQGRSFLSNKNEGIYMTLLLRPDMTPMETTRLTIVAAVSIHEAISKVTSIDCGIKWPNDLVYQGKKLCGILTEMSTEKGKVKHVELGIGINVFNKYFEGEINDVAISIAQAMVMEGKHTESENANISMEEIIKDVLSTFYKHYMIYHECKSLIPIKEYYDNYLLNINKVVKVIEHNGSYEAIARGIDADGELIVEKDGDCVKVMSGEVSIRGVYGYV